MHTLKIENLYASIKGKNILNDFSLTINSGEIHTIMGPNGAGKSTLSKIILGDPNYIVEDNEIISNRSKNIEIVKTTSSPNKA